MAKANAESANAPGGIVKRSPSWAFGPPQEDEKGVELPDRAQVPSTAGFIAFFAIFRPAYFQKSLAMAAFLIRTTIAKACGLDDTTLLEASRRDSGESQTEPGPA